MSSRLRLFSLAALLAGMTLVCYLPTYKFGTVDYDDPDYLTENVHVTTGLSAENIQWAFTKYHSANWHPLTWISHMLDVQLFGLNWPAHHVVNVGLHTVNVVLLFLMLASVTGEVFLSFLVAALFAIHPVNVESVAWLSQRKSTLSTMLVILSIWEYCRYAQRRSWRDYAISLVLFAFSLMAKQTMVTMAFALLLIDYWPLNRPELAVPKATLPSFRSLAKGWWRLFPEKIPYLLLAIGASAVTLVVQQQAIQTVESYPLATRLGNISVAYVGYLGSLLWPFHLATFYPLYQENITGVRVLPALLLLLVLTGLCCWYGRRYRYLLFGWMWYLGTLVPVIGLVQVGMQSMADRYAYFSFWGLFVIVAWGGRDLVRYLLGKLPSPAVVATASALLMAGLGWLTYQQAAKWENTVTLFTDAIEDTDRNWLAHSSLAGQYLAAGNFPEVIGHCETALPWGQGLGNLLCHYGVALAETGSPQKGIENLERAATIVPGNPLIYTNLGYIYSQLGQFDKAIEQYQLAAERLRPSDSRYARSIVYGSWGNMLQKLHRPLEAAEKYDQAIAIFPEFEMLVRDAGAVDLELNNVPRAIERLHRATQLDPNDALAWQFLARALTANNQLSDAADVYQQLLQVNPGHIDSTVQLAKVLVRMGRQPEAVERLSRVLQAANASSDPNAKVAASTLETELGNMASVNKNAAQAVGHFDRALAAWGDNRLAANNLAWILATSPNEKLRNAPRAVALAKRVCELNKVPDHASLSTLAAAHAANGQAAEAVKIARQALAQAQKAQDAAAIATLQKQLAMYEKGEAYREP